MTERAASSTLLARRFRLVLLHLAEEAHRDLEGFRMRPARATHSLRIRMKNLRALLMLVKPRTSKPERKAIVALAAALKDAFSKQRDADVAAQLRARLNGRRKAPPQIERPLKAGAGIRPAMTKVAQLIRLISKLSLKGLCWADVIDRHVKCYRDGQKAMKACLQDPSAVTFHRWRRPVKDLFYQSQVLQPLTGTKARRKRADRIGDRLGKLNDLEILRASLEKANGGDLPKRIARKQKTLRTAILKTARKLFARRPREIASELERCLKFHPKIAAQAVRQT
jgi:CHAD domain-containing protein